MKTITEHREQIDKIDSEILALLNERARHVIAVGDIKKKEGAPLWVPSREEAIYERLLKLNTGPFPAASVRPVFREIISASLSLEEVQRVGYFGSEGTFSHLAGIKHFGLAAKLIPAGSIPEVFDGVTKGHFKYGIIPIENSIEGVVNHSLDMFMDTELVIMGEIYVEISQNLLSRTGNISDIKCICSHPHALAQCRTWISKNLPNTPMQETESTAKAAERAKNDESLAAIGSLMAEAVYNLKVVEKNIQDGTSNFTRFLIIGRTPRDISGNDKSSIMFGVPNTPGALCKALEVFDRRGINMTKLESRPSKRKAWEYLFYTDIDGHRETPQIAAALGELSAYVSLVKVLGSYPKNEL